MKKLLLLWLVLFVCFKSNGQLGITVASDFNSTPGWQVVIENFIAHRHTNFLKHGTSAAIDYRLPLPSEKWRIQPAFHAMRATITYFPHDFEVYSLGLQANFSFMPFGKNQTNAARTRPAKLLLQLSPGIDLVHKRYDFPLNPGEPFTGKYKRYTHLNLAPNLGLHVLVEFELSEFLTLSPLIGMRLYPNLLWKDFSFIVSEGALTAEFDRTNWRQFNAGLRIGLDIQKDKM